MKMIILFLVSFIFAASVQAMPCDAGYNCVSKSGKFNLSFQRCRYRNHISLLSLKVDGVELPEAVLNTGWDGDSQLAFEVGLPTVIDGSVKILTAEILNHKKGIMRVKFAEAEPGPLKTIITEKMTCTIED